MKFATQTEKYEGTLEVKKMYCSSYKTFKIILEKTFKKQEISNIFFFLSALTEPRLYRYLCF